MVLFLAVASNVFGAVFAWLGTATWITNTLLAAPLPAWGTMTLLLILIFLLGWPFEWPAIVLIFLPLLAPGGQGAGLRHGLVRLHRRRGAADRVPVAAGGDVGLLPQAGGAGSGTCELIYRGMADFMVIQVICVVLVLIFPSIAMWFPNWLQERRKAARSSQIEQPLSVDKLWPARSAQIDR